MLRPDSLSRGQHATHLHKHHKLGRHRTVIKTAVPLINAAVGLQAVWRIDLGRIDLVRRSDKVGVRITADQAKIHLTVTDAYRKQRFLICVRSLDDAAGAFSALAKMIL